jgi:hypothetical protein
MRFECIKGYADNDNMNVVMMQGDIVKFIESSEGDILVEGEQGWCTGWELNFSPKTFVEHFKVIDIK